MKASGPAFLWQTTARNCGGSLSFGEAFAAVRSELEEQAAQNEIFAAHLEMMDDPMLADSVRELTASGMSESEALTAACTAICRMFAEIEDEYLRARVDDVRDICRRIERRMAGESAAVPSIPAGSVLVAEELLPSDSTRLDFSRLSGIICRRGSSTSHVCIISHAHGVPVQLGVDISAIAPGDLVSVDDPMLAEPGTVAERVRAAGRRLYVNAGSVEEVRSAIAAGADGIGLFRTEFVFMGGSSLPTEEDQFRIYRSAVLACEGKPLTIRTLDIGGDKQLACLPLPAEDNPFLGLRGIRLCLARPRLLEDQLRAILRAAQYGPVRIMLPMVSSPEEVGSVRAMLATLGESLQLATMPELGIMVETPAAVFCAPQLAACSDFFSVGSNDLTQYIMAADRGNASVAYLYDPMSTPVLKALELTVRAARDAGIPAGICGELASDPRATGVLLDMGFDSLSISHL